MWPGNLKQNPDKSVLLMDGYDLRVVLEGRIGLRALLLAKLTHFNIEGEPFVSVVQIVADCLRVRAFTQPDYAKTRNDVKPSGPNFGGPLAYVC